MQKLIPVEEAKTLMTEAQDWSLWGWLTEKRKLRTTADRAWEALDELEKKVRGAWSDDLKAAHRELEALASADGNARARHKYEMAKEQAKDIAPEIKLAVRRFKEADDEAYAARMQAEETFDEADRRLSTRMAVEGAKQAIDAWEMREKVIRKAEALGRRNPVG
ncbi:MAG: hypothetical protein LAQ69_42415 [Acidobacteriia bacterium]|nr:hypothetical protein [Terriglobia bacterium]